MEDIIEVTISATVDSYWDTNQCIIIMLENN